MRPVWSSLAGPASVGKPARGVLSHSRRIRPHPAIFLLKYLVKFRFISTTRKSGQTISTEDATPEALDRYHIALLAELQRDARQSNAELAQRIGLSAAPTWRRVKWLEEQGYITGYRAELDRRKIGLGVLAFVRVDA